MLTAAPNWRSSLATTAPTASTAVLSVVGDSISTRRTNSDTRSALRCAKSWIDNMRVAYPCLTGRVRRRRRAVWQDCGDDDPARVAGIYNQTQPAPRPKLGRAHRRNNMLRFHREGCQARDADLQFQSNLQIVVVIQTRAPDFANYGLGHVIGGCGRMRVYQPELRQADLETIVLRLYLALCPAQPYTHTRMPISHHDPCLRPRVSV